MKRFLIFICGVIFYAVSVAILFYVVGFIGNFGVAKSLTVAHMVFAIGTSAFILIANQFEKRDLMATHAEYADYRGRVSMLAPVSQHRQTRILTTPK